MELLFLAHIEHAHHRGEIGRLASEKMVDEKDRSLSAREARVRIGFVQSMI